MKKQRVREVKRLNQDHTAYKKQSHDLNLVLSDPAVLRPKTYCSLPRTWVCMAHFGNEARYHLNCHHPRPLHMNASRFGILSKCRGENCWGREPSKGLLSASEKSTGNTYPGTTIPPMEYFTEASFTLGKNEPRVIPCRRA